MGYMTVAEFSDMVNISKQSVYKRIKRLELEVIKQHGETVLNEEQVELLKSAFAETKRAYRENKPKDDNENKETASVSVPSGDDIIKVLTAELEQKNQEINNLHKLLEQQQQLLDQQQRLSLIAETRIKELEGQVQEKAEAEPVRPVGLFKRLFGG